jgi:hypothetical protein
VNKRPSKVLRTQIGPLLRAIRTLPDRTVKGEELFGSAAPSQKRHWLNWLSEYASPGYYRRKASKKRDARFAYNHCQCPAMLIWLAGRVGVSARLIESAADDAVEYGNKASQCAAIRRHIPWTLIECRL